MGFLHGELEEAKKEICKALGNHEKNYRPILGIIDEKDSAAHAQDWIVEDADVELEDIPTNEDLVRELDESDDDGEDINVDFESDDEHGYGL
ncbi:unnamed protein product [Arabidopsis halleri]